jgi:hypothetical protein
MHIFERIHLSLQRLNRHTGTSPVLTDDLTELLGKIVAQLLTILALSTKAVTDKRISELSHSLCLSFLVYRDTEKFMKKLVGRKGLENAISRLDALTMTVTVARTLNLEVTPYRVDSDENIETTEVVTEEIDDDVKVAKAHTKDIDDSMKVTEALTEDIDDSMKVAEALTEDIDNNVKVAETHTENIDDNVKSTTPLIEDIEDNMKVAEALTEDIEDNMKVTKALTEDVDNNVNEALTDLPLRAKIVTDEPKRLAFP